MGDGGSLVMGLFCWRSSAMRTTVCADRPQLEVGGRAPGWYGVFMPLCVLAVPIYDFVSVVIIR